MNDGRSTPPRTGSTPPRTRPLSGAERQRRHRRRERAGRACYVIEVPGDLVEDMYAVGLLPDRHEVDKAALSAAAVRALRLLLRQKIP